MNVTFPFSDQLMGAWDTASGYLRDGLDTLGAQIGAGYHTQHNLDDTHGTITASGSISERKRTVPMGEWINPAFDASIYTYPGASNAWTVATPTAGTNIYPVSYTIVVKTLFWNLAVFLSTLTVGGSASSLLEVALPHGIVVAGLIAPGAFQGRTHYGVCSITEGGTVMPGVLTASPGSSFIGVQKATAANFIAGANFTVVGQVFFEMESV
jgi:hypothetical protein